jgi:hypothetical protein
VSIYRRTDRVPLNDVAIGAGQRPLGGPPSTTEDWTRRRSSEPASGLLRPTAAWASALPAEVQPTALMARFPRVANLVAVLWKDPDSLRRYVDDLLVDKRGNRQGFPLDVLREIFELRSYYDELHPPTLRPWEVMNKGE